MNRNDAGTTDRVVVVACAKAIKELDKVSFHNKTKANDLSITNARNALWAVITDNGYEIDNDTYRIRKVKEKKP